MKRIEVREAWAVQHKDGTLYSVAFAGPWAYLAFSGKESAQEFCDKVIHLGLTPVQIVGESAK